MVKVDDPTPCQPVTREGAGWKWWLTGLLTLRKLLRTTRRLTCLNSRQKIPPYTHIQFKEDSVVNYWFAGCWNWVCFLRSVSLWPVKRVTVSSPAFTFLWVLWVSGYPFLWSWIRLATQCNTVLSTVPYRHTHTLSLTDTQTHLAKLCGHLACPSAH